MLRPPQPPLVLLQPLTATHTQIALHLLSPSLLLQLFAFLGVATTNVIAQNSLTAPGLDNITWWVGGWRGWVRVAGWVGCGRAGRT